MKGEIERAWGLVFLLLLLFTYSLLESCCCCLRLLLGSVWTWSVLVVTPWIPICVASLASSPRPSCPPGSSRTTMRYVTCMSHAQHMQTLTCMAMHVTELHGEVHSDACHMHVTCMSHAQRMQTLTCMAMHVTELHGEVHSDARHTHVTCMSHACHMLRLSCHYLKLNLHSV